MSETFNRSTNWIVNRPALSLALLTLISSLAIGGYRSPQFFQQLFGIKTAEAVNDDDDDDSGGVRRMRIDKADAIIVCESKSFFSPAGSRAVRSVVDALDELPHVSNVLWLDTIPVINIFGLPEPFLPNDSASSAKFQAARETSVKHPLIKGQFLSSDGETMLLFVNFDFLMIEKNSDCTQLVKETVADALSKHDDIEIDFLVTGRVPFFISAVESSEKNRVFYQLIGYGMIALMSVILFRGIIAVLIVAIAPAIGVFWTLGIIRFFDFHNNPFNDVVLPILISLVGFTDGVHLMVQIRRNRASGLSAFESAKLGVQQVGLACGLTSLTTAIGFGSLSLAHHEVVREFGWSCVLGVILTFVAVISVIPLACASWMGRRVHVGHDTGLIDKNLTRISGVIDYVLQHARVLSVTGILITFLLIGISLSLRPDERRANAVPESSDSAIAIQKMDEAMGGIEFSAVEVAWNENVASDSAEVLSVIRSIDQFLANEYLIGHPISIRNLMDALPGDGKAEDRMSMLELMPPPLKRAYYSPEKRTAKISFRVRDLGIAAYGPVFERLEDHLATLKNSHPNFDFDTSGSAIWRWKNLYQIVMDLVTSLGTASIIIFIVLSLAYRSLRIGLISIIPNMFPIAVAGTFLVLTGQNLEIVMVCAFTCCLGIAVDDTIHFLTRYLEERERESDEDVAIRKAFAGVGTALIMTTIVLVCGFLTVQTSDTREYRIFAAMGAITVAAALFGDLIFLPAILSQFNRRNLGKNEESAMD